MTGISRQVCCWLRLITSCDLTLKQDKYMTEPYFDDLENVLINQLLSTRHSLNIAVAWIGFDIYAPIFIKLINEGVKIKMVIDSNPQNRKQQSAIDNLIRNGVKIKLTKYPGYMHQKFCVIDKSKVVFGSYNWTRNASMNNSENLYVSDDLNMVQGHLYQFRTLWELSDKDVWTLMRPQICPNCKLQIFNLFLIVPDGYYQTRVDVEQVCDCRRDKVETEYFDISLWNNYQAILEKYSDLKEAAENYNDENYKQQLEKAEKVEIENYFMEVRLNRLGLPIIHAVGVRGYELEGRHTDRHFYKIIWKEQGTARYIRDEYDVE